MLANLILKNVCVFIICESQSEKEGPKESSDLGSQTIRLDLLFVIGKGLGQGLS